MRACIALILCLCLIAPAHAAPPTLRIFSANNLGRADLLPGDSVAVVIELRSDTTSQDVTAQHLIPDGFTLQQLRASSGEWSSAPIPAWKGTLGPDRPVNIIIVYRVNADAAPGDRRVMAQAQIEGKLLRAETVVRVCCVAAQPARVRVYFPVFRA